MESRLGAAALVALLVLLVPAPAFAGDETVDDATATADDWLRIGLARYQAGDFKGAVDAFILGNKLDPRPQFLFAIAQAERRRGNCKAAVVYYQKFIATSPPAEQADAARQQRHICEAAVLETTAPKPEPPTAAPVPLPVPVPDPAPVSSPAWYTDPIADVAVGGTVLLGLGSAALFFAADSAATQAAAADTYDQHAQLLDRADARHLEAVIALGATTAAAGVAVWRIFFHDRSPRRESRPIAVSPGPGVGLAIGGSF